MIDSVAELELVNVTWHHFLRGAIHPLELCFRTLPQRLNIVGMNDAVEWIDEVALMHHYRVAVWGHNWHERNAVIGSPPVADYVRPWCAILCDEGQQYVGRFVINDLEVTETGVALA